MVDFPEVFENELEVINFRREEIAAGRVAKKRASATSTKSLAPPDREHYLRPRKTVGLSAAGASDQRTARLQGESDLTGLAFSGGGIRSAAFCLGVLQALDSLSNHDEPHVLDGIDYLSAVSGGSYIGTSLVAGMMQRDYTFPFDSRLDDQETAETQHLRNYSNFLVPNGTMDYVTSGVLVIRGLLVNAIIVFPVVLLLALLTIFFNPTRVKLGMPDFVSFPVPSIIPGLKSFVVTADVAIILAIVLILTAVYSSLVYDRGRLVARERLASGLGYAALFVATCAFFEFQSFVLRPMFDMRASSSHWVWNPAGLSWVTTLLPGVSVLLLPFHAMFEASRSMLEAGGPPTSMPPTPKGSDVLSWLAATLPHLSVVLLPVATFLIAFAQRLANVAQATVGEATWRGLIKKYAARGTLYLAALIVPFLLWVLYIYLSFWGIRQNPTLQFNTEIPDFLRRGGELVASILPEHVVQFRGPVAALYFVAMLVLFAIGLAFGPNANSLHRLYRDRLSRAFLIRRSRPTVGGARVDRQRFSSLKPRDERTRKWRVGAAYSPYLLVNTAINLEASKELNRRGREADTFVFSPLYIGSSATQFVETTEMESLRRDLTLATAMATSGAAASANMGANTIKVLTFSLAVLNVRVGYWLPNPQKVPSFASWWVRTRAKFGTWYFALETFGFLSEKKLNVYLTDGGHIENLGIYELLRRRCKVILAVDAEADQEMTFPSFVKLQMLARIDLGIRIDLPWPKLQANAVAITEKVLYGPKGWPGSNGPHAAIGKIIYDENETGVLIYIKASLSGDENDYLIDYKRRNSTFPHETTVDQFFSEEQFEVYRALGFHAARGLFTGADSFGTFGSVTDEWREAVRHALALLNVPRAMANRVVARC